MKFNTGKVNVLVLAGGINRIVLFEGYTPGYKGLLLVQGKPLIEYTLQALRSTPEVSRICIVGPVDEIKKKIAGSEKYEFVSGGETLIENIHKGLNHFRDSSIALVTPSDLPLATPQAISDFLNKCTTVETAYDANILWSMIPEENFTGPYVKEKKRVQSFQGLFRMPRELAFDNSFPR